MNGKIAVISFLTLRHKKSKLNNKAFIYTYFLRSQQPFQYHLIWGKVWQKESQSRNKRQSIHVKLV